jgi:hypothetical protein
MEAHRVAGVLPSLVAQAVTGGVDVAQQTEVVVRGTDDPLHGGMQVRQQRPDVVVGQAPAPGVVQEDQPQGGCVHGAVVGRREVEAAAVVDELSPPDFVQDLARLLRGIRVDDRALPAREGAQGPSREGGVERQQKARGPDGVAAEKREIPRGSGCREHLVRCLGVGQKQVAQVGEAGREELRQPPVTRIHGNLGPVDFTRARIGVEVRAGASFGSHRHGDGDWSPESEPQRNLHYRRSVGGAECVAGGDRIDGNGGRMPRVRPRQRKPVPLRDQSRRQQLASRVAALDPGQFRPVAAQFQT